MLSMVAAGLMVLSPMQDANPADAERAVPQEEPTRLGDISVVGRRLDDLVRNFVTEVAAPNPGRGMARWGDNVCIGAANLRGATAQAIVDRVSFVAEELGVRSGAPGCTPNVIIVATDNGGLVANELVEKVGRSFRVGGSGMDRGGSALRAFQTSEAPVRWWHVSLPVHRDTRQRATRIPGIDMCGPDALCYPVNDKSFASRLTTDIVDDLMRVVIIIDVEKLDEVTGNQLADYVAMVAMAQVNPAADTSTYHTVLNVFDDPIAADGLTDWDWAYLRGLYSAQRDRVNPGAYRLEVASSIMRAHERLQRDDELTTD